MASYNLYLGADLTVAFDVAGPDELVERAQLVLDQVAATDFPTRARALARILVDHRVDVVGLQEVARWSSRKPGEDHEHVWLDFLPVLRDALVGEGETYDVHAVTANFRGSAVLDGSEVSVRGHNVVLVRRGSGVTVHGEGTAEFADAHRVRTRTPDIGFEIRRSWSWVVADLDGRRFRLVNTHLEAWDATARALQREELVRALHQVPGPLVLVGDFNESPERLSMPAEYADAWHLAGRGDGATSGQPAGLTGPSALKKRIDYVWVRGVGVEDCWVIGADEHDRSPSGLWPSDHAGVIAQISL